MLGDCEAQLVYSGKARLASPAANMVQQKRPFVWESVEKAPYNECKGLWERLQSPARAHFESSDDHKYPVYLQENSDCRALWTAISTLY